MARLLAPTGIKVTRIARGVPVGGDIEYADELTLGGAVVNRPGDERDNMNVLLAPLLAAPMTEAIISVLVIVIALKLAFFTIKKVALNVVLGIVTYMVCIYVLHIPMDIGFGVWGFDRTIWPHSDGTGRSILRLIKLRRGYHGYQ